MPADDKPEFVDEFDQGIDWAPSVGDAGEEPPAGPGPLLRVVPKLGIGLWLGY